MADFVRSRYTNVTIGAGASLSDALNIQDGRILVGVQTAATWDTNAMSFQVSLDGVTYVNLYNAGTEYSMAGILASTYNAVNTEVFLGARYLKVRSGTAAAAVNQADATIITLVFAKVN